MAAHTRTMESNPAAFRKVRTDFGHHQIEGLTNNAMLGGCHPVRAPDDMYPGMRGMPEIPARDQTRVHDFTLDTVRPRTTGYSPGHHRSMCTEEFFFPETERRKGRKPLGAAGFDMTEGVMGTHRYEGSSGGGSATHAKNAQPHHLANPEPKKRLNATATRNKWTQSRKEALKERLARQEKRRQAEIKQMEQDQASKDLSDSISKFESLLNQTKKPF
uniref:Uncharacterized protein n=1 Tax=Octactis speculum TaxID=3111310 RepID=A0A7S2D1I5_9STRA